MAIPDLTMPPANSRDRNCEQCGKPFRPTHRRGGGQRFCSEVCKGLAMRSGPALICPTCGQEFYRTPSQKKPPKHCSRACYRPLHGDHDQRLHRIWRGMKSRCNNANNVGYARYGARGIRVCAEWSANYVTFRDWALLHGYRDDLSIDRIDNDGPYAPDNCRWATPTAQNRNRGNNRRLEAFGETKTIKEWSQDRRAVVPASAFLYRLRAGWGLAEALLTPSGARRTDGEHHAAPPSSA